MDLEQIKIELKKLSYDELKIIYRSMKGYLKAKKHGQEGIDKTIRAMNTARLDKVKQHRLGWKECQKLKKQDLKKLGIAFNDNLKTN